MKKTFLLAVFALCTIGVFGQGGSWYVGGIAGYSSTKVDNIDDPQVMWYFGPEIGTFFNANWSAGIVLGMDGKMKNIDSDGNVFDQTLIQPNLYGRRWWSVGEKLGLFAGLDASFGTGSRTTTNGNNETTVDMSNFNVNLNAGVAYALAQRWTLLLKFAALGYDSETMSAGGQDITTTTFGLVADGNITSNQFIFVGLYWNFIQP